MCVLSGPVRSAHAQVFLRLRLGRPLGSLQQQHSESHASGLVKLQCKQSQVPSSRRIGKLGPHVAGLTKCSFT